MVLTQMFQLDILIATKTSSHFFTVADFERTIRFGCIDARVAINPNRIFAWDSGKGGRMGAGLGICGTQWQCAE
jgi:hypothetical protein